MEDIKRDLSKEIYEGFCEQLDLTSRLSKDVRNVGVRLAEAKSSSHRAWGAVVYIQDIEPFLWRLELPLLYLKLL